MSLLWFWLFQNKISCSCRFPLLGSAFHSKDSTMRQRSFQKTSGIKLWKGTDQRRGRKIFQRPWICLGALSTQSVRSGTHMVPPRPCLNQAVPPNWMTKQGGNSSEMPPRGQWKLWMSYVPWWERLVTVCMWQQHPKHSTSLAYMEQWQEGSHYSKNPPWVLFEGCKKNIPEILKPCGKKFCGLTKPKWNSLA